MSAVFSVRPHPHVVPLFHAIFSSGGKDKAPCAGSASALAESHQSAHIFDIPVMLELQAGGFALW